jgi:hypothetical protein
MRKIGAKYPSREGRLPSIGMSTRFAAIAKTSLSTNFFSSLLGASTEALLSITYTLIAEPLRPENDQHAPHTRYPPAAPLDR